MKNGLRDLILFIFLMFTITISGISHINQNLNDDWVDGRPDGCTSITVGNKASIDGSVTTSHTCDSHRTRAWLDIMPAKSHPKGAMDIMLKRTNDDALAMPAINIFPLARFPRSKILMDTLIPRIPA